MYDKKVYESFLREWNALEPKWGKKAYVKCLRNWERYYTPDQVADIARGASKMKRRGDI